MLSFYEQFTTITTIGMSTAATSFEKFSIKFHNRLSSIFICYLYSGFSIYSESWNFIHVFGIPWHIFFLLHIYRDFRFHSSFVAQTSKRKIFESFLFAFLIFNLSKVRVMFIIFAFHGSQQL